MGEGGRSKDSKEQKGSYGGGHAFSERGTVGSGRAKAKFDAKER